MCPKCGRSMCFGTSRCSNCNIELCKGCEIRAKRYDVAVRCGECLDNPNRVITKEPDAPRRRIVQEPPQQRWPFKDPLQEWEEEFDQPVDTKKIPYTDPWDTKP